MIRNLLLFSLIVLAQSSLLKAQSLSGKALIDSLEAELPNTKYDTNHVKILGKLSFYYQQINPEKGIEYGERGLTLANKIGWKKREADFYINLGINYFIKSEYPKALEYYNKAIKINEEKGDKNGVAKNLGNIGVIYQSKSDYSKALEYFNKALKLNEEIGNQKQVASQYGNIGIVYANQSNYPKALLYYNKALKICEELGNKNGIARNLGNIGGIYRIQSDYAKALEYYHKALKINEELGNKSYIADNLGNMGIIYKYQSDYPKALEYYGKALKIYEELENKSGIAITQGNIGLVYKNQSNYAKALEYYHKSLKMNEELGRKSSVANNLGNIGNLYLILSQDTLSLNPSELNDFVSLNKGINLSNAIQYSQEAISIFEAIGELDSRSFYLEVLAEAYRKKEDYKNADKYYQESVKLKDSVFNQEKQKELDKLTKQREQIEAEKEIELLMQREQTEKREKELITYSAIGGVGLVGIFALLIYRRLRKEKKLSNELDQQKTVVEESKAELELTHTELKEKNTEIIDSINYAKTIQEAMLPWSSTIAKSFPKHFIIYKPKDIVSGDFYWFKEIDEMIFLAVADCTGHGIPGSMLSIMGSSILDEAVLTQGLRDTDKILNELNLKMIEGLNKRQDLSENRDGMDICLVRVQGAHLQFSGAKRPLFILQNGKLETIKGDRNSIAGERHLEEEFQFSSKEIQLKNNSKIYLTSDGFVDQIGTNGKKFGTKGFKQIISQNKSLAEINSELNNEFNNHIGSEDQRDDITILGVEL